MTWLRLVRAELRKLTTTWMPWGFLIVLVAVSAATAAAILWGTDMDGSKGFIATAEDQRSLLAFGANAVMGGGLLGAIAVAREYGHATVVPTFLTAPRRVQAMSAQFVAVMLGGAVAGLVGGALTVTAGAITIPLAGEEWLLSAGAVTQVLATSALGAAAGALLGAGAGALVRNTGGAVATVVLLLIIAPPVLVQMIRDMAAWVPNELITGLAGVGESPATLAAIGALAAWALVPAAVGILAVQRRDVV